MSQSELPGGSIGNHKTRDDTDVTGGSIEVADPEYFEYKVCNRREAEELFEEFKAKVLTSQQVKPALLEVIGKLLQQLDCSVDEVKSPCKKKSKKSYIDSDMRLPNSSQKGQSCGVCLNQPTQMYTASCGHTYCNGCWSSHIETQLSYSFHSDIECMDKDCNVILTEDMVLAHLTQTQAKEKYLRFVFTSYIDMHPCLRFCPGPDCSAIIYARDKKERKVICTDCKISFCFACGTDYHAPTSCEIIQKWYEKFSDDVRTNKYLLAYTKKCPNCTIHTAREGRCYQICCPICKTDFCWKCDAVAMNMLSCECDKFFADHYVQPHFVTEEMKLASDDLRFFQKWNKQVERLKLEAEESKEIREKIEQKVLAMERTWIDWQYLVDATELLKRCRCILQYTYPHEYYLTYHDPHKFMFEDRLDYLMNLAESLRQDTLWEIERYSICRRNFIYSNLLSND